MRSPVLGLTARNARPRDFSDCLWPMMDFPVSCTMISPYQKLGMRDGFFGVARTRLKGMRNDALGFLQFGAFEFHPWRTNARAAMPRFLLDEFDELNEFRHRVHAQKRQKPIIKRAGFVRLAFCGVIEELDGFHGQSVGEAGNPSDSAHVNAFDDCVINADKNGETVAEQRANGGDAANIGA